MGNGVYKKKTKPNKKGRGGSICVCVGVCGWDGWGREHKYECITYNYDLV